MNKIANSLDVTSQEERRVIYGVSCILAIMNMRTSTILISIKLYTNVSYFAK